MKFFHIIHQLNKKTLVKMTDEFSTTLTFHVLFTVFRISENVSHSLTGISIDLVFHVYKCENTFCVFDRHLLLVVLKLAVGQQHLSHWLLIINFQYQLHHDFNLQTSTYVL